MDDQKILALYFSRDEQAVLETARKYGSYCYSIADNILHSAQDAEETVNDTYLQTWNAIPPSIRMFSNYSLPKLPGILPSAAGEKNAPENVAAEKWTLCWRSSASVWPPPVL